MRLCIKTREEGRERYGKTSKTDKTTETENKILKLRGVAWVSSKRETRGKTEKQSGFGFFYQFFSFPFLSFASFSFFPLSLEHEHRRKRYGENREINLQIKFTLKKYFLAKPAEEKALHEICDLMLNFFLSLCFSANAKVYVLFFSGTGGGSPCAWACCVFRAAQGDPTQQRWS